MDCTILKKGSRLPYTDDIMPPSCLLHEGYMSRDQLAHPLCLQHVELTPELHLVLV